MLHEIRNDDKNQTVSNLMTTNASEEQKHVRIVHKNIKAIFRSNQMPKMIKISQIQNNWEPGRLKKASQNYS